MTPATLDDVIKHTATEVKVEGALHIDADILAYQAGGSPQADDAGEAREIARRHIAAALHASSCETARLHLTSHASNNGWRNLIAGTSRPYKGNRSTKKPAYYEHVYEYLVGGCSGRHKVSIWADREADDGIAFSAGQDAGTIFSRDKDLRMLSGRHMDWSTFATHHVPFWAFRHEVDGRMYGHLCFWEQMLTGDHVDNIPPVRLHPADSGIGPAQAYKYLKDCKNNSEACDVVARLFQQAYGQGAWPKIFARQASMLWIRIHSDALVAEWYGGLGLDNNQFYAELQEGMFWVALHLKMAQDSNDQNYTDPIEGLPY